MPRAAVSHRADDKGVEFSLDIGKAYPEEAGVESWRRRLRLDRENNEVRILDRYALRKPARKITLTLMTPHAVQRAAAGELRFGGVVVMHDPKALSANVDEIQVEDMRLRGIWGERMYRILLVAENPPAKGEFEVRVAQKRPA